MSSDMAIIPVSPSPLEIWSVGGTVNLLKEARKVNEKLTGEILITRKMADTNMAQDVRDALNNYGLEILSTEILQRGAYVRKPYVLEKIGMAIKGELRKAEAPGP